MTQLVERVYNNTEPDFFFLYKEDALNFPKSMVVYLKVSIALKSELHYDACLNAKRLELSDEFKAKLGLACWKYVFTELEQLIGKAK